MNKIHIKTTLLAFLLGVSLACYSQTINTVAGYSAHGFSGDGGQATAAELNAPSGVALDALGNIYIADYSNNRIRMVNTSGIISTIAGNGAGWYNGDGGPATSAELYEPIAVSLDALGNIYIADTYNQRIRKINTSGIINTIVGNGNQGYTGDNGQATNAEISDPHGVTVDALGNIYIGDYFNLVIRKVNTSGIISTIAGVHCCQGFSGDGGPATNAEIDYPCGLAVDISGNIYIADWGNNRIRIVNTSGIIKTFAGVGTGYYSGDGGPATAAGLSEPYGVTVDASENVYIADWYNNRIRMVNTSGIINTLAGIGPSNLPGGYYGDGGPATAAELNEPIGIALDALGNVYIGDNGNNRIRKVNSVTTGISEILTPDKVTIYPIPTTGTFTISSITHDQTIELYNYAGQKVLSAVSHQLSASFDISSMPNGIYLIRILNKDGSVFATKKIVKA